jgi:hypothetical protein
MFTGSGHIIARAQNRFTLFRGQFLKSPGWLKSTPRSSDSKQRKRLIPAELFSRFSPVHENAPIYGRQFSNMKLT